ncbi:MAG: ABC transporter ATP-binding protein [Candidatus Thermoplasmatota archaeon]|nr:ABC transporter ATP-binding protein [Candidatus Thermoplasmatota archaeon]MBU1940348.1 ABC transporter ATP-binding protein [Candidatus Thermoplasmatota archaeon]
MGDTDSITRKVACPHCKNVITVHGTAGETIEITCPQCSTTGIFPFPKEKPVYAPTDGSIAIAVNNLEFSYPKSGKKAINGVSFEIKNGEIFGFLGPNGAGKTTTQKIIIGLLKQYMGTVELLGKNLKHWKTDIYNRIGVGFELPNHYQKLTALENLELFSSFYRAKTIPPMQLLKMVELEKDADQRVATFSKGMRSKLNFARSLINDPEVLFLDEPTTGLDPVSSRLIKDIIIQKKKEGKAIFLTTHNMTDADELCDRVGFIVDGKLTLIESPKELKIRHGKKIVKVEYLKNGELLSQEFDLNNLADNSSFLNLLRTGTVQTIHTAEATLDEIFIKATGRQLK